MGDSAGKVYLVGAGPGDPGLVTLRAKELIDTADVLVYDNLVNRQLLEWAKTDCEKIYVGKESGRHAVEQDEIESILVERADRGLRVVRLKGGDPFVFGRGGEEVRRLDAAGISFEIVPGITAALASAAYAGIPLTHRDHSSAISLITGHENPEKTELCVDFKKFANTGGTLCIYMGMGNLPKIVTDLLEAGQSPETPVVVVQWATLRKQRSVFGELATICETVAAEGLSSPAIIVVGDTVSLHNQVSWFEQQDQQTLADAERRFLNSGSEGDCSY